MAVVDQLRVMVTYESGLELRDALAVADEEEIHGLR